MARERSPNRDKAFELFKEHNGNIQNREIAKQLGVSEKTVSGWKSKDDWNGVLRKNERSTPKKRGAPVGNKNAVGNDGGAPEGNSNATKHGLFAKYVPEETAAIMESLEDISGRDILWGNIKMQYAAIIRAQRIMWVDDSEDDLEKASSESWGEGGGGENRKLIYAYERYATFLSSQSRAMGTLTALIKQYLALDPEGERAKQLEVMDATISKLKAEANAESDAALTAITFVEDVPTHD